MMKDFFSFISFVFNSNKMVPNFFLLSVTATILQYASLAMMFIFIKAEVSGVGYLLKEVNLGGDIGLFLQGVDPLLFSALMLVMLVIFYIGYAFLSFLSKKCSMSIIKNHKDKITIELKTVNALDGKKSKMLLNQYLEIYRRFFQILSPLSIVVFGVIFISFINFWISIFITLSLIFIVIFYHILSINLAVTYQLFANEYLINRRKLIAQLISVFLFFGILLSVMLIDLTVDATVVLVVVGRILLGNIINALHPIFEVLSKIQAFVEIRKKITW